MKYVSSMIARSGLRHLLQVIAKDVVESVEVVFGAPDCGRARVVLAAVVPCENGVQATVGEVVTADSALGIDAPMGTDGARGLLAVADACEGAVPF